MQTLAEEHALVVTVKRVDGAEVIVWAVVVKHSSDRVQRRSVWQVVMLVLCLPQRSPGL